MDIDTVYQKLYNRSPTPRERSNLLHVKDALGIGDNDALLTVVFALQYHLALYRDIPRAMRTEAQEVRKEMVVATATLLQSMMDQFNQTLQAASKARACETAPGRAPSVADYANLALSAAIMACLLIMGVVLGEMLHAGHHPPWVHQWPVAAGLLNAPAGFFFGPVAGIWMFISLERTAGRWIAGLTAGILVLSIEAITLTSMS